MTRPVLLAALALLAGCGSIGDTEVLARIVDMKADRATPLFMNGGHCSQATNTLTFYPADGIRLSLTAFEGRPAELAMALELGAARTFAFTAPTATSTMVPGTTPVTEVLPTFSHVPLPSMQRVANGPEDLMSGPPPGLSYPRATATMRIVPIDAYLFAASWGLSRDVDRPPKYRLQLPDAIANGRRVTFAPIEMTLRDITYSHDLCLR